MPVVLMTLMHLVSKRVLRRVTNPSSPASATSNIGVKSQGKKKNKKNNNNNKKNVAEQ